MENNNLEVSQSNFKKLMLLLLNDEYGIKIEAVNVLFEIVDDNWCDKNTRPEWLKMLDVCLDASEGRSFIEEEEAKEIESL